MQVLFADLYTPYIPIPEGRGFTALFGNRFVYAAQANTPTQDRVLDVRFRSCVSRHFVSNFGISFFFCHSFNAVSSSFWVMKSIPLFLWI